MRKQYHSRLINGDTYIWDVHRLVELTQNLEVRDVPLASIQELDENYWFQRDEDVPTARAIAEHMKLVEETDLKYPIILCEDGRIMDGMHRVLKAFLLGHQHIRAVQFSENPSFDYINVNLDDLEY